MHMHPNLTISVYAIIVTVLVCCAIYWFFYTRGLRAKQATLDEKGRLPVTREEGIAIATEEKERAGRTGTIS